ncbi:hypothetical protein LINPERHAP1_LOCUS38506 [Linum perenne]
MNDCASICMPYCHYDVLIIEQKNSTLKSETMHALAHLPNLTGHLLSERSIVSVANPGSTSAARHPPCQIRQPPLSISRRFVKISSVACPDTNHSLTPRPSTNGSDRASSRQHSFDSQFGEIVKKGCECSCHFGPKA